MIFAQVPQPIRLKIRNSPPLSSMRSAMFAMPTERRFPFPVCGWRVSKPQPLSVTVMTTSAPTRRARTRISPSEMHSLQSMQHGVLHERLEDELRHRDALQSRFDADFCVNAAAVPRFLQFDVVRKSSTSRPSETIFHRSRASSGKKFDRRMIKSSDSGGPPLATAPRWC